MAMGGEGKNTALLPSGQIYQEFSLAEILKATHNFNEDLVIGKGGFGKVYKGFIEGGVSTVAAIKRLDINSGSGQGADEFWTEVKMLTQFRHCNLVSLIGFCRDKEMALVYEYMRNGTLHDHLHKAGASLSWIQRLKICVGAARGLDYLHTGASSRHRIIHRDVKSANILLDDNLVARIADFGLSKVGPADQAHSFVSTNVKGSFGYYDPEYFSTGLLTRKSDVYSFGVVLFEVLCGKRAVHTNSDGEAQNLANWAQECIEEGQLDEIIDSRVRGEIVPECLKQFTEIANKCLESRSKKRPTMAEVVFKLEVALSFQQAANSPADNDVGCGLYEDKPILTETSSVRGPVSEVKNPGHSDQNPLKGVQDMPQELGKLSMDALKRAIKNGEMIRFSKDELKCATRNFRSDMKLGSGGFGESFIGWLDEYTYSPSVLDVGLVVVVKKVYQPLKADKKQWVLEILQEFRDPHFVKLIGYCLENEVLLLVSEFMQNGSVHRYLITGAESLPWATRVEMALGVAEGLVFLYEMFGQYVDTSLFNVRNIMLDKDFNAKFSDFEVAKIVRGSLCKDEPLDPLYFHNNKLVELSNRFRDIVFEIVFQILLQESVYSTEWKEKVRLLTSSEKFTVADPRLKQEGALDGESQLAKAFINYFPTAGMDIVCILRRVYAQMEKRKNS